MKRFTDTDIWKKQWFQDLEPKNKIVWFYLKDTCDSVGVWSVNKRLAEFQIGEKVNWDKFLKACNNNIKIVSDDKWWITNFCIFQYGELSEKSSSKPIISYIKLLKKHNLWIGYVKGIEEGMVTLQEKEKEQDKEKVKEKDPGKLKSKYGEYKHVWLTDDEYETLPYKVGNRESMIKKLDEYLETTNKTYKNHSLVMQQWNNKDKKSRTSQELNLKDFAELEII